MSGQPARRAVAVGWAAVVTSWAVLVTTSYNN